MVHDAVWENTFLIHIWWQNGPFSRHFGVFHGPKCVTGGSKRAKNTCWSIPKCLEERPFLAPKMGHKEVKKLSPKLHRGQFGMPKQGLLAPFEPVVTRLAEWKIPKYF